MYLVFLLHDRSLTCKFSVERVVAGYLNTNRPFLVLSYWFFFTYSTVGCRRTVCRRTARLEFHLKRRTTPGWKNELRTVSPHANSVSCEDDFFGGIADFETTPLRRRASLRTVCALQANLRDSKTDGACANYVTVPGFHGFEDAQTGWVARQKLTDASCRERYCLEGRKRVEFRL